MWLLPAFRSLQRRLTRVRAGRPPRSASPHRPARRRLSLEPLVDRYLPSAAMVQDLNPGPTDSTPSGLVSVSNTLYFSATTPDTGAELWKSDGTTTALVKDIAAGAGSSSPQNLTNVNGTLFFTADDGVRGRE